MDYDKDKVDEMVLALLFLTLHENRAWKGHDWDAMNRLHEKGMIGNPEPRGLGLMTSVVIDREIGNWHRFVNRRQVGSYTGLCSGEYSSGKTRLQSCVTKLAAGRVRPLANTAIQG